MAAAALCRRRGGGLFFLFTLLSLVCLTSSLIDNKLENIKEIEEQMNKVKAQRAILSELMSLFDPIRAYLKNFPEESQGPFAPLGVLGGYMETTMSQINEQTEELDATIECNERKLGLVKKLIALEEHKDEL